MADGDVLDLLGCGIMRREKRNPLSYHEFPKQYLHVYFSSITACTHMCSFLPLFMWNLVSRQISECITKDFDEIYNQSRGFGWSPPVTYWVGTLGYMQCDLQTW